MQGSSIERNIVCIDSYDKGIMKGCFYNAFRECEHFESLTQFLLRMEEMLDECQKPQAYTAARRFSTLLQPEELCPSPRPGGVKATFELKIIFRQHSSWQGTLYWREQQLEQSFRSVLELVILMDSALRSLERGGAA